MNSRGFFALTLGLLICLPAIAWADNTYAKRTMVELEDYVKQEGWERAATQIETVKDALKDADAETAEPIKKRLAEIEKLTGEGVKKVKRERIMRNVDNAMKNAKDYVDQLRSCESELERAKNYLTDPDNQPFLDPAVAKGYFSEIEVVRKQALAKQQAQRITYLREQVESAEKKWPEKQKEMQQLKDRPLAAENAATEMSHELDRVEQAAKDLPGDDSQVKPLLARYKKLQDAFAADYGSKKAAEALEQMKRYWDDQQREAAGWEQETSGPKFAQMLREQSAKMSALGAPQTVKLVANANQFLANRQQDPNNAALLADPQVKAFIAQVTKARDDAWIKLSNFAAAILTEAESMKLDKNARDRLDSFANDDLRLALAQSPSLAKLQERGLALVKKFDEANAHATEAADKLYNELVDQANRAWPAMAAKFKTEAFDANAAMKGIGAYRGKFIRFENANNRMGWDYRPGTYDFAVNVNGQHVAGKYDPMIAKVVDDAAKATGKDFSNDSYDVIALIEDTGPVTKIARAEGKLTANDGSSAVIHAQRDEVEQGIIVRVVGLHLSPVAAAVGQGAVDRTGAINVPAGVTSKPLYVGGGGSSWLSKLVMVLLGASASVLVLVRAEFAPILSVPQIGQLQTKLTPTLFALFGWVFLLYGLYSLLTGWIIFGLLISLVFMLAGAYLSVDSLEGFGALKPAQAAQLKSNGTLIGIAIGGLVLLSLVLSVLNIHLWVI